MEYVMGELLVLIPVLNIIGQVIKKTCFFCNCHIRLILLGISIFLASLWMFATRDTNNFLLAVFLSITQGVLCAGFAMGLYDQLQK